MDTLEIPGLDLVQDRDDDERERRFNPYRYAQEPAAKQLIGNALECLAQLEAQSGIKRNKRRPHDQQTYELTVDAILSDLAYDRLIERGCGVFITRSKQLLSRSNRYRPRVWTKMLPDIVDALADQRVGLVVQELGWQSKDRGSKASVLRAGRALIDAIKLLDLDLTDFGERPADETIILKRPTDPEDYWDEGGRIHYEDTDITRAFRDELRAVNAWLSSADISFSSSVQTRTGNLVDDRDRQLLRIFNLGRFDRGGRLFGGFWQPLSKQERFEGIKIDGERIVELDYGQAGTRIVYGLAGRQPPEGDLYSIPGYLPHRDGIKRVMSAMLFATKEIERFPRNTKKLFRKEEFIRDVIQAISNKHPDISNCFFRGIGHEAQFVESTILLRILKDLREVGVTALPIHDAILVPASSIDKAREVMKDAFLSIAGVEASVSVERGSVGCLPVG
ncbi:hypothetical protein [uncultured Hoeflea sp.]|uniref:hypothetical protein n=1 Tax=uncultured Hoeflea sp. TaxID=538666 RepID=UPI0030EB78C7|tara:strand:- start:149896 stop:151242 length:1347 start_codon:yes stop_codon:yes gene_type:complete